MAGDSLMGEPLVAAILDEYKELSAEVRTRLDLQQRNMNVLAVLVTAITTYLVSYVTTRSSSTATVIAYTAFGTSEIVVLASLVPVIINVFLWRHLDHDANIIDKASYINTVLRPALVEAVGLDTALGFEKFLHARRKTRPRRMGPLLGLGQEHVPMFAFSAVYLAECWYLRFRVPHRAASSSGLFDGLLYVGTALTAMSIVMAIAVGREYARVGQVTQLLSGKTEPVPPPSIGEIDPPPGESDD
jgi:hypothetical protein